LHPRIAAEHEVTAFNRSAVEGVETMQADLRDVDGLRAAVAGRDVVVHLAAKAGENYSWDELRDTNIEGTRNVFTAAVEAGVRRVVFASSGATVAGCEYDEPYKSLVEARYDVVAGEWPMITVDMPTRPKGVYGSTKVWGEALARQFADTTSTEFVAVRIGYVNAEDAATNPRAKSVWCSQRDVVRGLELASTADMEDRYAVFFANSNNRYGYRDLSHGERVFGFVPQDGAD
jgi:nucleoside-diphosphate-sugar epimerase